MTLRIRGLSVCYASGVRGLRDFSLEIAPGECVAVVGESGSGKSTLIRAVLGLLPPGAAVSGEVMVGSHALHGLSPRQVRRLRGPVIGYVAQDPFGSADPVWNVGHHVAEAWYAHRRRPYDSEHVRRLRGLGLTDPARWLRRRPASWSGGMLQRADIVAGSAHDPAVVLADEPTSALDADLADAALAGLVGEARSLLVASHDLPLVSRYADRVVVLRSGQQVEELEVRRGGLEALARIARHPYTRELVAALPAGRGGGGGSSGPVVARLERVSLGYRGAGAPPVVCDVDLEVRAGEIVGLAGPSGAGKTTVLRAVAGLLRPRSGVVRLGGLDVWERRTPRVPRPGYVMPVFQDASASLDPRWPIWRTVAEALVGGGRLGSAAARARAGELLADLGLGEVDPDARPSRLSGGQRQRVALARVLAGRPSLVAADEPTAQLDPTIAAEVTSALEGLARRGLALVVVSHDEARLRALADRVLRVRDGRVVADP
ncbi:ABC transporter ATP-binding protein [Actinopolymorpha alba]|uniref:ABC transporter ATP-binding protein n=1 Tax=Actinopolymorpha alba TaxID=533267 RepID=UPI0003801514|nr:ATP-binding cassette domain-containing protein [Actinopolymorpha alba]